MQYKVPQNVDIEDKVVGPLSLRQFLIILITAGIMIVLYFIFPAPIKILYFLLAILIGFAGGAIAFTNYGGQNMEVFLMNAWTTFIKPRYRVWKKVPEPVLTMEAQKPETEEKQKSKASLEDAHDDLSRLAELVDSGGHLSVSEKDRVLHGVREEAKIDEGAVIDIISNSETEGKKLSPTIEKFAGATPKREEVISEVASVPPTKKFSYPEITIVNNDLIK